MENAAAAHTERINIYKHYQELVNYILLFIELGREQSYLQAWEYSLPHLVIVMGTTTNGLD